MLRVGDRVHPHFNMPEVGVNVEIQSIKVNTWLVGGASSTALNATIKLDADGTEKTYKVSDLRLVERQ